MLVLNQSVDLSQKSLWIVVASIFFNPTFWNFVARKEHHNKTLTKMACGNSRWGCYGLAVTIFSLGILRDHLYQLALADQPKAAIFAYTEFKLLAAALFAVGSVLVVSSMWALGVTGTYLGDYFGILMDDKVESFPFNVTSNPMYYGSTLSFLATAIWYERPAGLLLSVIVFVVYKIALTFEEPFTGAIYAARDAQNARKVGDKSTGTSSAVRRAGADL